MKRDPRNPLRAIKSSGQALKAQEGEEDRGVLLQRQKGAVEEQIEATRKAYAEGYAQLFMQAGLSLLSRTDIKPETAVELALNFAQETRAKGEELMITLRNEAPIPGYLTDALKLVDEEENALKMLDENLPSE